jgi:hypothetical protein
MLKSLTARNGNEKMQNYLQGDLLVLDDKDGIESAQFYKKSVM